MNFEVNKTKITGVHFRRKYKKILVSVQCVACRFFNCETIVSASNLFQCRIIYFELIFTQKFINFTKLPKKRQVTLLIKCEKFKDWNSIFL